MKPFRRFTSRSKPPTKAVLERRAQALLLNARSIDHVTVDALVRDYKLSPKKAAEMLGEARGRRG